MVHKYRGREAVFLVYPPTDWKPQRFWSIPPSFTGGELHAKNLVMREALGFARIHNKQAVQSQQQGNALGKWAIVSRCLRPRYRPAKGGAA